VIEADLYAHLLTGVFIAAGLSAAMLLLLTAPYGRHARGGWGPTMDTRWAWVVMESPSALWFLAVFLAGAHAWRPPRWRSRRCGWPTTSSAPSSSRSRCAPAAAPRSASWRWASSSTWSTPTSTRAGCRTSASYDVSWLWSPAFLIGLTLFVTGYRINRWADRVLANLRKPGETGYKIPRGGLYEVISCPNYFGELLEWTGFAIAAGSLAGWAFVVFTAANLIPRALAHHRWYREKFPDYPPWRKAVIPMVL
jgi:3-oxo-5-alpha-steroid 4-dehydrogenase 1